MDARDTPADNPPDNCEAGGCDDEVYWRVKFENPADHVYYCRTHGDEATGMNKYKYRKRA